MPDTPNLKPVYGETTNAIASPNVRPRPDARRGQVPQGPNKNKAARKSAIMKGLLGALKG